MTIRKTNPIRNEDVEISLAYELTSTVKSIEEVQDVTVYGVTITQKDLKRGKEDMLAVPDISTDFAKVERLLEMMSEHTVTIITALDVIEDYIG